MLFINRPNHFLKLLSRLRWISIFLLLIYSFNTPGEYIRFWPFEISPTYEGIENGLIQLIRIVIVLSGLSLLLATTSRETLMSGIYNLLKPLKLIGISPDRFTARLWLTLHYVEKAEVNERNINTWSDFLKLELDNIQIEPEMKSITLKIQPFTYLDLIAMIVIISLVILL